MFTVAARRFALPVLIAILLSAVCASTAGAVRIGLTTFKTSIDVDLKLTQHTKFTGERPGCFASYENWDLQYVLDIDSKPSRKSKIANGTSTVTPFDEGSGVTFSYGAKNSFKQSSKNASWELQLTNPPNCPEASKPESWVVSPTCKKISERVIATLIETKSEGTSEGDGMLQLLRSPKAKPTLGGASIGPSCLRTLHDPVFGMQDANVGITLKETVLDVPVPDLKQRLAKLAEGDAGEHPSFKIKIRYWSRCSFAGISPHTAEVPNFSPQPFSQPHQWWGSFNADGSNSLCTLSGSGTVTVRREGKVTRI